MIGIRQKLALGFLSILAVSAVIGVMTMRQMDDLGKAIDVILRENYRSVIACQDMKEALERIDSAALISLVPISAWPAKSVPANTQNGHRYFHYYRFPP